MSDIKWSPEQLSIINSRNDDLLVSAAAGAGKTTVMVERVLGLITDSKSNIDIDRLLIVTFTRDAAANMKDKLSSRLEAMLDEDPGNKRLLRQQMLLQNAQITTIDSFCNSVVKEFFYRIDIDPSFRIADEAEISLLKNKVLDEMLEEKYSGDDSDFIMLVETYCGSKNDDKLGELIGSLAKAAYAQAWPADWLNGLEDDVRADIGSESLREEWKKQIAGIILRTLSGAVKASAEAVGTAAAETARLVSLGKIDRNDAKAQKIADLLNTESMLISTLTASTDYDSIGTLINGASFDRLTLVKDFSDEAKEQIKNARNAYKDIIGKIKEKWYSESERSYADKCSEAAKPLVVLIKLTKEYLERLLERKKEKNLFEFSDISHFALEILAEKNENGEYTATEAALELRERFHDIFIDEYQDSDSVQEQIAETIAGRPGASPYTFMVGDVKQSIYKFRMAKPELFISRAHRYEEDEKQGRLIHLGLNFRSGQEVIDSVNDVFRLCMHENVGKVEYDKSAELVCGKALLGSTGSRDDITEIILADQDKVTALTSNTAKTEEDQADEQTEVHTGDQKNEAQKDESPKNERWVNENPRNESPKGEDHKDDRSANDGDNTGEDNGGGDDDGGSSPGGTDLEEYGSSQLCAKAAAIRIKELIDGKYQIENKDKTLRDIKYGDIVILLRSAGTNGEIYREELEKAGIPVFSDSGQGFLGSYEISVVVNFLRLLDNPYQDIPLVSVLGSVMGKMDDEDLAKIRVFGGFNYPFWQCVKKYAADGQEKALKDKCEGFLALYSDIRKINMTRDIDKVIFAIYERTGFYLYCMALPSGQSRVSNLDQLLTYAANFEKNNSNGLFDFVGYLEEITKSKNDLDEAVSAEGFDAVRIMTIHKSKGLEYPVVIIGDAAKQFNMQDRNREVVISPDYGISSKHIDLTRRVKHNTVRRALMAQQIELDTIGEELRLLYVAMTRAMKKLIIIGKPGKKGKTLSDWQNAASASKGSGRYPDHYIATTGGYMDVLYPAALLEPDHFLIRNMLIKNDVNDERQTKDKSSKAAFAELPAVFDESREDGQIMKELNYVYENDPGAALPVKLSVSDLKFADPEEITENLFSERKHKHVVRKENTGITGAEAGTLYHKIMQFIPFDLKGVEGVRSFLDGITEGEGANRETSAGNTGDTGSRDANGESIADTDSRDVNGENTGDMGSKDACGTNTADVTGGKACENDKSCGIITPEERLAIDDKKITAFFETELCQRMRKADGSGLLLREQPFMFGMEACEADPVKYADRHEIIIVQGIIDCMFEEEDGIVILDYKTDAVDENGEEELAGRYKRQLDLYALAASRILQKRVKEKIIYSFALGKCILL